MKMNITDIAYGQLLNAGSSMPFPALFAAVAEQASIPEAQMRKKKSTLYSELSLDGRFVSLPGNVWDLKNRYSYAETHQNIEDTEDDEDEENTDAEEELIGLDIPTGADAY